MNSLQLEDWLCDKIAAEVGVSADAIDREEAFAAFGMDSMQAVALSGELETLLGRRLAPTLLWDHPSVTRLAAHLAAEVTP